MIDIQRVMELKDAIAEAEDAESKAQAIFEFQSYFDSNNVIEQEQAEEVERLKTENGVLQMQLENSRAINAGLRTEIGMQARRIDKEASKEQEQEQEQEQEVLDFEEIMKTF